jgi:hypothetical protein
VQQNQAGVISKNLTKAAATLFGSEGWGFESLQARQKIKHLGGRLRKFD